MKLPLNGELNQYRNIEILSFRLLHTFYSSQFNTYQIQHPPVGHPVWDYWFSVRLSVRFSGHTVRNCWIPTREQPNNNILVKKVTGCVSVCLCLCVVCVHSLRSRQPLDQHDFLLSEYFYLNSFWILKSYILNN